MLICKDDVDLIFFSWNFALGFVKQWNSNKNFLLYNYILNGYIKDDIYHT